MSEAPPQAVTGRAEPQRGSGRRRGGRFVGTDQTDLICQNYSEKEEKEEDHRGKDNLDADQVVDFLLLDKDKIKKDLSIPRKKKIYGVFQSEIYNSSTIEYNTKYIN